MEVSNPVNKLNKMPRSAYHCFTRFCKIMNLLPKSEQSFPLSSNKELYKHFVERILDMKPEDIPPYANRNSFVGKSQSVVEKWREADELTRSVFKEIAKRNRENYKKVSCLLSSLSCSEWNRLTYCFVV